VGGEHHAKKQKMLTRLQSIAKFCLSDGGRSSRSSTEGKQIEKRKWRDIDLGDHLYSGFEISSYLDLSSIWNYIEEKDRHVTCSNKSNGNCQDTWQFSPFPRIESDTDGLDFRRELLFNSTLWTRGRDNTSDYFWLQKMEFQEASDSAIERLLSNEISSVHIFYSSNSGKVDSKYPSLMVWKRKHGDVHCLVRNVSPSFQDRLRACRVIFNTFIYKHGTEKELGRVRDRDSRRTGDNENTEVDKFFLISDRVSVQLTINCLAERMYYPVSKHGFAIASIVADGPFSHSRPSLLRLSFSKPRSDKDMKNEGSKFQLIRVEGNIFSTKLYKIIRSIFMINSDSKGAATSNEKVPCREVVQINDDITTKNSLDVFYPIFKCDVISSKISDSDYGIVNTSLSGYNSFKSPFVLLKSSSDETGASFAWNMDAYDIYNEQVDMRIRVKLLPFHRCDNLKILEKSLNIVGEKTGDLHRNTPFISENVLGITGYFSCDNTSQDFSFDESKKLDIICDIHLQKYYIERIQ